MCIYKDTYVNPSQCQRTSIRICTGPVDLSQSKASPHTPAIIWAGFPGALPSPTRVRNTVVSCAFSRNVTPPNTATALRHINSKPHVCLN